MTTFEPAPGAAHRSSLIDRIEIVGLRLLAVLLLGSAIIDGVYLVVRFISTSYILGDGQILYWRADDIAYGAWALTELAIGWLLATRAPRVARWLRARTRVDLPA